MSTPLYRDPRASVEERIENLLALMTLDEKLAQLGCLWSTAFVSTGTFDPNTVVEKMPHGIGQVTRIGASTGLHPPESATLMNAIQQVAVERTRLGIPVIFHEESTGGSAIGMRPFSPRALDSLPPGTRSWSSRWPRSSAPR